MTSDTCRIRVYRYKRGDDRGEHFDEFDVPVGPDTTVLDALLWIVQHCDPTLMVRHSCLHGSCGTCGVQVNGRERLACLASLAELGGDVTVEPLANLPVLADLVVDMGEFFARFPEQHPAVRASELLPGSETPDEIPFHLRFEDCIECGLCLSACPVAATADSYAGPAALAAAERLLEDGACGAAGDGLLDWASGPDGVWRCHLGYECTAVCPTGVGPAERLMALRGRLRKEAS
jgi:succinate dehydrogenase / fumarate reductase, iron-sulfur subunit